jgi:CRP/FNR family transcriptional regulator, dissimilatory nitrate respiration regulator
MDIMKLNSCPLFKGIDPSEIEELLSGVRKKIRKFKTDSAVVMAGEPVSALMVIMAGTVKGEMVDYSGHVIKIEDIPAPGLLAPAFIFGSRNKFPVNVVAVTDTEIFVLEKPDFLKLLSKNETILGNFLTLISDRSQFLSEKIKFLSFKTIKGKLAQLILQKAGATRSVLSLDMTQNELADFFGVARPSIGRALGEMEEERVLNVKASQITILNRKKLAEYMSH